MMLPLSFYTQDDVLNVAKSLLGYKLCSLIDGQYTSGYIVETEAYAGVDDMASHAYGSRRTTRNEAMYAHGGIAYVYLCYGIHHLFNVVTNVENTPHAVLVRALQPAEGIDIQLARRKKQKYDHTLCAGPGSMSQAMGITKAYNFENLYNGNNIWIEQCYDLQPFDILCSPRVGVGYAGIDALLPYRYRISGNKYCSSAK
ncbi:MAG: DNA-3-methyladenine glycosylase [Cytophagales bacterium]|nr:DNA-3-methyladenine glycosylase [Cytophagales bacterium]